MKLIITVFIALLTFSCASVKLPDANMYKDVAVLAHDSLMGRKVGTEYERKAAAYIAKRFSELRLEPKGTEGFYQDFIFRPSANPHQEVTFSTESNENTSTGRNVVAFLDNKAKNTVVIGAHYDHLGMGGSSSLHRGEPAIHNGADDNASGVAMMLHLAYVLQQKNAPKNNNYLFIAFSGEEDGLLGSNYYVKNATIDLAQVNYMINMDMVGRLNEEKSLAVYGVGTSPVLPGLTLENTFGLKIVQNESGVGPSDHTSFYLADLPVLHFFTGQHEDYHRPSDDTERINFNGMEIISKYIFNIISLLDDKGKLAFTKTKNESEVVPEFKVTLGVVPDYLFDGKGMRLDGVSEGKPAQNAGMKKGDIVKKMGDHEIKDMMSYMESLSKFEKGQTVDVIIERDGKEETIEVTF